MGNTLLLKAQWYLITIKYYDDNYDNDNNNEEGVVRCATMTMPVHAISKPKKKNSRTPDVFGAEMSENLG